MPITHPFVSPIPDEADATLVRPSNWNADHSIDLSDMYVANETPAGTIDGVNVTFTLAQTPKPAGTLMIYRNQLLLYQGDGDDYTISGLTITMAVAPVVGDRLRAFYWRLP